VSGRGRGRPPGSSKKAKDALASAATAAAFAKGYPVDATTLALLMEHNAHYAFRGSSGEVGTKGELDLLSVEHLPPMLSAPGYDESLNVLSGAARPDASLAAFHATEKDLFSQMRSWAPLGDLELTHDALAMQCAIIHKRITLHDPFFKYKGMSSVLGEPDHLDYEQDEDGMTDIANTDDLIDNDFELDAGNAATAAEAERELSSCSSNGSHSPHSRPCEELE